MNYKNILYAFLLLGTCMNAKAQSCFKFAFISDTHVGSATGAEDLRRTVEDINADTSLKFVIHTGDVTEFGADEEIFLAKQILDSLNKPLYIIPGNHDANWSESGANTFRKVFGGETVAFQFGGYLFVGTGSGPNLRMGPGQVPRENVLWLDSVLADPANRNMPVIFLNHYPQDSSLNNWFEITDLLRKRDTRIILHGHGHADKKYNYDGIPAVMGRSTLRANKDTGAYNIVTVRNDSIYFQDKTPGGSLSAAWAAVNISNHHLDKDPTVYFRPSYAENKLYPQVKQLWQLHDKSDIGAGLALDRGVLFSTNTAGRLLAINAKTGKIKWEFLSGGKVYSTPAVAAGMVVFASSDRYIYGVDARNGRLVWKFECHKPNVACPLIVNGTVYIGGSDGHFRALELKTGKPLWDFAEVKGFVVDKPLYYGGKIYFGCWANDFYALDALTGHLIWKWNNGASNRMFSPAACWPVAANNRIFIVAPDRFMTVLDAGNGTEIWRKSMPGVRVRESMGLSQDSSLVYVKTMDGNLFGISTTADSMTLAWKPAVQLPYEICPTAIPEKNRLVFLPTNSGSVAAVSRKTNKVAWIHKVSNGLVTGLLPVGGNIIYVSTMDGKITCLQY